MPQSPAESFALWMSKRREELNITLDVLEVRTGIKKQHLSVLERASPHSLTGKPVVPKRPTVEKIAKGLEAPIQEALNAAGYASTKEVEGKEYVGVKVALLGAKNFSEKNVEEFYRDMAISVEIAKRKLEEREKAKE
ncbi:MAG TPA: helix-turn-helix transcriptional regulator [Pyrinomonadaceae bacterium]|nr:helix-turn-helix transcriptional regulator [Pyrinomonadaceae bacterium]